MNADASRVRLFFAVWPNAEMRAWASAAAEALPLDAAARAVPYDTYHATLAFVGEVAVSEVAVLRQIGRCQRASVFDLRFDAYEYWPKPEVVVTAARQVPAALEQLWRHLHRDLAAHSWAMEPKRLRPHVTLARKVSQAPVLPAMSSFVWPVREFSLMRSDTRGMQPAYTVVDTWSLLDETANS